MTREDKVQAIYKHCEIIGSNKMTIVFVLAMLNDKALTKFYNEYLAVKPNKDE